MLRLNNRPKHLYQTKAPVHKPALPQFTTGIPRSGSQLCLPRFLGPLQPMQIKVSSLAHSLAVVISSDTRLFFFLFQGGEVRLDRKALSELCRSAKTDRLGPKKGIPGRDLSVTI